MPEDCSKYGNWDEVSKSCVLNQDLFESVEITENNISLDCNNHKITGPGTSDGIYLNNREGIRIKNCNVLNFTDGISFYFSNNNILDSNKVLENSNNEISLYQSSNNTLTNNIVDAIIGWGIGILLDDSNDNIISNNFIFKEGRGILFLNSTNNTLINNTIKSNVLSGIELYLSNNNKIYNNNFIDNSIQAKSYDSEDNFFNVSLPTGGNYWSDYTGVDEKSGPNQDEPDSDGIGDTPYVIYGLYGMRVEDRYPFMGENGWELPVVPGEFWVEVKEDGECIYQDEFLTTKLKCFPQGWILKVSNPEKKSWQDIPSITQIEDITDGISGWTKKEFLNYDPDKQIECEKKAEKLDPSKNPEEGGTVPVILESVNHYYNNTDTLFSLYSSNDDTNKLSVLKENSFPIELILAIAAQESGESPFNFNNGLMTYDYGHGVMQITFRPLKFDIKYLQIVLNSDIESQIAKSGPGSPGNETNYFGDLTENAVKRFQKKYDISIIGTVGPLTRTKLNEIVANNREVFATKGILPNFQFEDFLKKGFSDVTVSIKTFDNRGIGSRLKIPPCGNIINDQDKNHYKNCYRYYGGKEYKEYEPHQYYNNQLFKHYTNSPLAIFANIKDGLRILQWNYIDSLAKNINSIDIIKWAGAAWRYNHGVPRRVIEKGDEYLARIADKFETDREKFDILEEYFPDYKIKIPNNNFLDDEKKNELAKKFKNYQTGEIKSPGEFQVYDSQGRVTGLIRREIRNEIPDSDYYDNAFIIYTPSDSYRYRIVGTKEGEYELTISSITNGEITTFTAVEIPIVSQAIHQYEIDWQVLSQDEKGVVVKIDLEGDGIFDQTLTIGEEFQIEETNLSYQGDTLGYFSDEINLKAVLTDEKESPLPNKEIIFKLGNQTATSTTNEEGIATTVLILNLVPKEVIETHLLEVIFPGDEQYLVNKAQAGFTLKGAKWLKHETIKELEEAKTGNQKIDRRIDKVIWFINKSLDENLWLDASRLIFLDDKVHCLNPETFKFNPKEMDLDLEGISILELSEIDEDVLKKEARLKIKRKCFQPKLGLRVFHYEKVAVRLMIRLMMSKPRWIMRPGPQRGRIIPDSRIKEEFEDLEFPEEPIEDPIMKEFQDLQGWQIPEIPEELKKVLKEVIAKLVKADTILAKVSIADAKATPVKNLRHEKIVKWLIGKAEKELTKAKKELTKERPDRAISGLAKSWLHSQLAIKLAGFN